ncbi:MAG: hypothetical protein EBS55_01550 [Flavobacteriaceae bacterium]|nr:hypothetical protein [Flavobacteriaceae bacterium]
MKNSSIFFLFLITLLFFSCQDETETVLLNSENSFTKTSPITPLISRVSQYETTADNVLDGTSNCSIKLPVHVTVNNQYVYVSSETDYQIVQNIKNQSTNDDDEVHFTFPITIVNPNFYEYTITSESQFESILGEYGDDSPYHDISCIDFNYPISINTYNTNNQVASSITLQNDNQLYNFVNNITDQEIVGFVFPLTLTNSNNENIIVTTNSQLELAIENVIADCETSSSGNLVLLDVLTSGSWHVSYFYGDGNEYTSYYDGYNFIFNPIGTSTAIKNGITTYGDWDLHDENDYQIFELHFNGDALEEMEEEWKVLEFTATSIRLKHESDGVNDNHYLNLSKN